MEENKLYYVVYLGTDIKKECKEIYQVIDVIKNLYITYSEVCLGEFLDFISIEGASIQETVDIFSYLMSAHEEDAVLQIYNTDEFDYEEMLKYLEEKNIQFCERG